MVHSRQEALSGWEVCYIYLSLLTLPYGAFTPGSAVWVRGMLHIPKSTHPAVWCIHARKRCLGERSASLNVYISVYSPCRMVHSRQEYAVWVGGLLVSMFISQSTHPAVWCIHARKRCLGGWSACFNVYISVYRKSGYFCVDLFLRILAKSI